MSDGGSGNSLQAGHSGRARGCRVSSRWGREPSGLIKESILYKRKTYLVLIFRNNCSSSKEQANYSFLCQQSNPLKKQKALE